ncbi:ketimine reductase mu-crystallin-like [Lineus longissimus]|uniref:ketimine reductase mu-crystallin-like n=1 Tax=Lineus longissimus TaxID=88925 RepID=UPI002B4DED0B
MASKHSAASKMPIFIGPEECEKYLDLQELYRTLEGAFGSYSRGTTGGIIQPVRTVLPVEKYEGFYGVMPVFSEKDNALGTKLVSFYSKNTDIATHQAVIVLNNASDGSVKAILDGGVITDIRTAMSSAVATKVLKKSSSPMTLAILGAGAQAISHHKVFSKLFDLSEVRIWSRTFSKVEQLSAQLGAKPCRSAEEAVKDADVIVTATMSKTPILMAEWVKSGAHINSVGACRPDWHEVDPILMRKASVFCDSREAAAKESGDIILAEADIYAEIGEILNGTISHVGPDKTTVFKSLGMAIEDIVSAKLVYDNYIKENA